PWRLAIKPGKEAGDGGAVADVRRARAGDLDFVLDRLHQRNGTGGSRHLAAVAGDEARQRVGGGGLIEAHGRFSPAQRLERRRELRRLAHVGECFEAAAHLLRQLAAVYVERRPTCLRHDGEGERERRVCGVGAPGGGCPGDGVRVRHDERVSAELRQFGANTGKLFACVFAGEAHIVQRDRSDWRGRALGPNEVDQVWVDRDQLRAGGGTGFL